jgi:hypothetical protein
MAVVEVTARKFRDKQKDYLDLADNGAQILLKRGKKQSYVLTPVDEDDLYFTPEMLAKIEHSRQQAKEGKVTRCKTYEKSLKLLESL